MFHYEDMSEGTDAFVKFLSDNGYTESERDAYVMWKSISYKNGTIEFVFEYSRNAGNLKRVYVHGDWDSATDLHVDAMHFNSRVAKYVPGKSFEEKIRELVVRPHAYCEAAHREHDTAMRHAADIIEKAIFGDIDT